MGCQGISAAAPGASPPSSLPWLPAGLFLSHSLLSPEEVFLPLTSSQRCYTAANAPSTGSLLCPCPWITGHGGSSQKPPSPAEPMAALPHHPPAKPDKSMSRGRFCPLALPGESRDTDPEVPEGAHTSRGCFGKDTASLWVLNTRRKLSAHFAWHLMAEPFLVLF